MREYEASPRTLRRWRRAGLKRVRGGYLRADVQAWLARGQAEEQQLQHGLIALLDARARRVRRAVATLAAGTVDADEVEREWASHVVEARTTATAALVDGAADELAAVIAAGRPVGVVAEALRQRVHDVLSKLAGPAESPAPAALPRPRAPRPSRSIRAARAGLAAAQAHLLDLRERLEDGQAVDADTVAARWSRAITSARARLLGLPARAPSLAGVGQADGAPGLRVALGALVDQALQELEAGREPARAAVMSRATRR
jgi:hypothetical protein